MNKRPKDVNLLQYCSVLFHSRGGSTIRKEVILEGIRKEFLQEG